MNESKRQLEIAMDKDPKNVKYKEAYEKADIVVFLVNHNEFAELNYREDVKVLDFCGTFKK